MPEYRSIRIDRAPWRALLDHFLAKIRVYRLWDEFGYEPKEQTVRDLVAVWTKKGEQAKKVMEKHLGPRVASGVRFWYDRKVFKDRYGKERRARLERLPLEERMKHMEHAAPEIKELWAHALEIQGMVKALEKSLDAHGAA